MRKIFIISVILCAFVNVWAQDIIVTKKGEEIFAKVEEIGDTQIKYKKSSHLSGPVYSLLKTEVFMIKYENGSRDVFGTSPQKMDNTANLTASNNDSQSRIQGKVELLEVMGTNVTNRSGKSLSKDEAREMMAIDPKALALYNTGLSNNKTGNVWGWISTGCFVGGLTLTYVGAKNAEYNYDTDKRDYTTAYVGLGVVGGSLVCMIPWLAFKTNGAKKIDSAVDIYNSEAIKRQNKSGASLNIGVMRSGGIGLALNF